jgi:hypothetical protein
MATLGASVGTSRTDSEAVPSETTAGGSSIEPEANGPEISGSFVSGEANLGIPMTYFKLSMLLRSNDDTEYGAERADKVDCNFRSEAGICSRKISF